MKKGMGNRGDDKKGRREGWREREERKVREREIERWREDEKWKRKKRR